MSLETGTYIADLVAANPTSSDPKSQGDDHIRLLKNALLNTLVGFDGGVVCTGADGGSADAYTVTPDHSLPGYASRLSVAFSPIATNVTTAPTINISGIGAKSIKRIDGSAPVAGELVAGSIYVAIYNGTEFRLLSPTKQYIDQLAFGTALPNQAGNSGKVITSDGTSASWSPVKTLNGNDLLGDEDIPLKTVNGNQIIGNGDIPFAVVLLATLSPTAAAAVDALNIFTSEYDDYLILLDGIKPSATDSLLMRFAVSGVVDAGNNYFSIVGEGITSSAVSYIAHGSAYASSSACLNGRMLISNVNSASAHKGVQASMTYQLSATQYQHSGGGGVYTAANAISGLRFLWNSGATFVASGAIKIYGIKK